MAAKEFGLSRVAIGKYLGRLVEEGLLVSEGNTKARRYALKTIVDFKDAIPIAPELSEDVVWRDKIFPNIKDVPRHIIDICQYGFTEMFNNVIDHSGGSVAAITYRQTANSVAMMVNDDVSSRKYARTSLSPIRAMPFSNYPKGS